VTHTSNAERARVTLDAVEIMDNIGTGDWTATDALALTDPTDLVDGLREYANYLEALLVMRGLDVPDIRRSARNAAARLAERG
jgi:hypothetical protein